MDTSGLIAYYRRLVILQYQGKTKAEAHIAAFVGEAVADQIIDLTMNAFDLDTAVGAQLDILSKYVGIDRAVYGLDLAKEYFATPRYNDPDPSLYRGFFLYGESGETFFARYGDTFNKYYLTDTDLRTFIKYKIDLNKLYTGLEDIDTLINEYFGAVCLITDNGDMSINYDFDSDDVTSLMKIIVFTGNLPGPSGVEKIITGIL